MSETASTADVFASWDGAWYRSIAESGYADQVPQTGQSNIAFYPLSPIVGKAVAVFTGLSLGAAGPLASSLVGLAAVLVIWTLVRDHFDSSVATRSVALLSFFPTAFVLSSWYAESLFLLTSATCLLMLSRRHWVAAGLAAGLAGATRPNGILLSLCCLWAAVVAIRERRHLRPLAAPLLSVAGFAAFHIYLWVHTGEPRAYTRAQSTGWGYSLDWGRSAWSQLQGSVTDPLVDFNRLVNVIGMVVAVIAFILLIRLRAPVEWSILCGSTLFVVLILLSAHSAPRFVLALFPLVVALAAVLKGDRFTVAVGMSAVLLGGLTIVGGTTFIFTP